MVRSPGGSFPAPSETCPDRQRDVRIDKEEAGTTRIREFAGLYGCMCVRKGKSGAKGGERTEGWRDHMP